MRRTRLVRLLASTGVIVMVALSQLSVAAAPPTMVTTRDVVIDITNGTVSAACGFPVHLHTEGFFKTITFVDADGNPTRQISQAVFHGTLSANGKSMESMVAGPEMLTFNADGTVTLTIAGVSRRNVPGAGHVGSSAGQFSILLTFDKSGNVINEELLRQVGLTDPISEICAFLAPDSQS
jgi:hypothetical protein